MRGETNALYPSCPAVARTVQVGGSTKAAILQKFLVHAIAMNEYGKQLWNDPRFVISEVSYALRTVELRVRDLGFADGGTTEQIYQRAQDLGLEVCPLELGPFLRLQFLDQPEAYRITLSAHKLAEEAGVPNGFYLRRVSAGLWLRGYTATSDFCWDPDEHFVFARGSGASGKLATRSSDG